MAALLGYTHCHSYDYLRPGTLAANNGDEVLVSPLRDPLAVYGTWYARYGESYVMDPDHPKSMESAWRALNAIDKQLDVFYLPVDLPVREERLADLSSRMGREIVTDWAPQGQYKPDKPRPTPPPRESLEWIYELPMVRRFYGGLGE